MITIQNLKPNVYTYIDKTRMSNSISVKSEFGYKNQYRPSFAGVSEYNSLNAENIKKAKIVLENEISQTFKTDRQLISNAFTGEINAENKFSKLGYYLNLKEKGDNQELNSYLQSLNMRLLDKKYNDFYNSNMKSYYDVAKGEKAYLNSELNEKIAAEYNKYNSLDRLIESEIDEYFIKEMETKNSIKQKDDSVLLDNEYAQKLKTAFQAKMKENPLLMKDEDIFDIFKILNEQLDTADKKEYDKIYENLDTLSESLYTKNKDSSISSWKNLTASFTRYWEENTLPRLVNDKVLLVDKLNKFVESDAYKNLNRSQNMGLLFDYRGSGELSLKEKCFLIDIYRKAGQDKKSYGLDLISFLIEKPTNNNIRKQIVSNLVCSNEFANENFDALKQIFISDINDKNTDSDVVNKKIGNARLLDLVLEQLQVETYDMSEKDKVSYLKRISEEDLNKLLENLRQNWLDEKFKQAFYDESEKYDPAKQFDNVLDKLTMNIDGKDVDIFDFVNDSFKKLYGENADLRKIELTTLNKIIESQMMLSQHDAKMDKEYLEIMKQMSDVYKGLHKDSEQLYREISKVLDKLEMVFPAKRKEIRDTRGFMQKLKDGVLSPNNIIPAALGANTLYGSLITTGKTIAASSGGEPHGLTLGGFIMLAGYIGLIGHNVYRQFKRG